MFGGETQDTSSRSKVVEVLGFLSMKMVLLLTRNACSAEKHAEVVACLVDSHFSTAFFGATSLCCLDGWVGGDKTSSLCFPSIS